MTLVWAHLDAELITEPRAAAFARRRIGALLDELGWSSAGRADLVLAVSEAVTNCLQHAYPGSGTGSIFLQANTLAGPNGTRRLCINVIDHGMWNPSMPQHSRGGLSIMRAATARMTIHSDALGTRVTMISGPEPAPSPPTARSLPPR
jgi:anti-sigma regulatory factor (Ser/Thr protein kinase)